MPFEGDVGASQHHGRSTVAAHHIQSDGYAVAHRARLARLLTVRRSERAVAAPRARDNGRRTGIDGAGASARRNLDIQRTQAHSTHDASDACCDGTERLSFWERP